MPYPSLDEIKKNAMKLYDLITFIVTLCRLNVFPNCIRQKLKKKLPKG